MFRFALIFCAAAAAQTAKPPLTLDEFFNAVDIRNVRVSPDGHAVAIETVRADWEADRYRNDLWLYRDDARGSLVQLTRSGHDHDAEWSPDGSWIAFLSDRESGKTGESENSEKPDQVWAIASGGGDAFAVTHGEEKVHAFAWSADSRQVYYATRTPWDQEKQEAYKKDWKDVVEFRESERGDAIERVEISTGAVKRIAATPWRVKQMEASSHGTTLAFLTDSISERQEDMEAYGIYLVDAQGGQPRTLVQRPAVLDSMHWTPDCRHIFFSFLNGAVEGSYQDAQPRVYWVDAVSSGARLTRWSKFPGAVTGYTVTQEGGLLVTGRMGTEVQVYREDPHVFVKQPGRPGTYERISAAAHATKVAFVHSTLTEPPEVYFGEGVADAHPITAFNRLFAERALPEGQPYHWTADDGVTVEGMLIYPPGKLGEKNLRTLTLIHGGPEDADGNHFEADWYQWSSLAATQGWLVFEPNYRGSVGYGDQFALGIIPNIVSKPGKDILEGVEALVKDGIADPDNLTIGGYSYGGYLTNWLITQTTRFRAAVSGAGAVEHVANWGNDDTTYDDAYFLGGLPWDMMKNYNDEAAIWQMNKVKTPTHIVAGADDVRVYVGEQYLLERALRARGVPVKLLIFPGEGHELDKNPWHGKIKVREELKWLETWAAAR
ncbi:MAG TPA: S9 family peptidase [Bryobacteraceae bacterium]|nr:S9 family peptidase [Bryobacteraceae bacterium]